MGIPTEPGGFDPKKYQEAVRRQYLGKMGAPFRLGRSKDVDALATQIYPGTQPTLKTSKTQAEHVGGGSETLLLDASDVSQLTQLAEEMKKAKKAGDSSIKRFAPELEKLSKKKKKVSKRIEKVKQIQQIGMKGVALGTQLAEKLSDNPAELGDLIEEITPLIETAAKGVISGMRFQQAALIARKIKVTQQSLANLKELHANAHYDEEKASLSESIELFNQLIALEELKLKDTMTKAVSGALKTVLSGAEAGALISQEVLTQAQEVGAEVLANLDVAASALSVGLSAVTLGLSVKKVVDTSLVLKKLVAARGRLEAEIASEKNPTVKKLLTIKLDRVRQELLERRLALVTNAGKSISGALALSKAAVATAVAAGAGATVAAATPGLNIAVGVAGGVVLAGVAGVKIYENKEKIAFKLETLPSTPKRKKLRIQAELQVKMMNKALKEVKRLGAAIHKKGELLEAYREVERTTRHVKVSRARVEGQLEALTDKLKVQVELAEKCSHAYNAIRDQLNPLKYAYKEAEARYEERLERKKFYTMDPTSIYAARAFIEQGAEDPGTLLKIIEKMQQWNFVPEFESTERMLTTSEIYRFIVDVDHLLLDSGSE